MGLHDDMARAPHYSLFLPPDTETNRVEEEQSARKGQRLCRAPACVCAVRFCAVPVAGLRVRVRVLCVRQVLLLRVCCLPVGAAYHLRTR